MSGSHGAGFPRSDTGIPDSPWEGHCCEAAKELRDRYRAIGKALATGRIEPDSKLRDKLLSEYEDLQKRWNDLKDACAEGRYDINGIDGQEPPSKMPPRNPREEAEDHYGDAKNYFEWGKQYELDAATIRLEAEKMRMMGSVLKDLTTAGGLAGSAFSKKFGPESTFGRWVTGKALDKSNEDARKSLEELANDYEELAKDKYYEQGRAQARGEQAERDGQ